MRKPPPTTVYRVEHYDLEGTYLNDTYQYLNRPGWWPGVCIERDERQVTVYSEGTITWERP